MAGPETGMIVAPVNALVSALAVAGTDAANVASAATQTIVILSVVCAPFFIVVLWVDAKWRSRYRNRQGVPNPSAGVSAFGPVATGYDGKIGRGTDIPVSPLAHGAWK
jgi:hypothetical protein